MPANAWVSARRYLCYMIGAACFRMKFNFLLPDNGFFVVALLNFLTVIKRSRDNKV